MTIICLFNFSMSNFWRNQESNCSHLMQPLIRYVSIIVIFTIIIIINFVQAKQSLNGLIKTSGKMKRVCVFQL